MRNRRSRASTNAALSSAYAAPPRKAPAPVGRKRSPPGEGLTARSQAVGRPRSSTTVSGANSRSRCCRSASKTYPSSTRRSTDRVARGNGFDPGRRIPRRRDNSVSAILDAPAQHRIVFRKDQRCRHIRLQGVGEREHALEVSQADAKSAIGREQSPQGHGAARFAAQLCIRRSASTTSSWSDALIAGYSGKVTNLSHILSARGAVPGTPPSSRYRERRCTAG